jgi:lysophospholipase L1-like esterase
MPDPDEAPSPDPACRLGVLAFGDSITNGGGELQWGVALRSWAQWTSRALGVPYSGYAVDGARVQDVLFEQIPAFEGLAARRDARYDVGCLYIGVNDVRGLDWDAAAFAADLEPALRFLSHRCDRVLALTAPLGLGLPPAGPKVAELNAIVTRTAERVGALVVDLSSFGARNHVMADRVHPTAFGQVAIAERALAVLASDGLPGRAAPSSMIRYRMTRWRRLRGDMTYVYRSVKFRGWAVFVNLRVRRARAQGPPGTEGSSS